MKKVFNTRQSDPSLVQVAKDLESKVPSEIVHSNFDGGSKHEHREMLRIRTQQIAIGLPMDELMFSQFLENLLGLHLMPWDSLITTRSTYIPLARNQIHDIFIGQDRGTHLLMLDSDVLPPPQLISTLLGHNKDMVGGWYAKKEKYPLKQTDGTVNTIQRPVVYDYSVEKDGYVQRLLPGTGLEKIDGAGAGCWLMSRHLAEKLGKSPYGDTSGEDLILCDRIREAGFDMFVDWSMRSAHCGVFFV